MRDNVRTSSLLIGILAGLSFSTASIIIRLLTISVESIVTYRLLVGGTLLLILLRPNLTDIKEHIATLLIMGTLLFLHFYLFVSSVKDTYILNATLLVNTTPIISLIILSLIGIEKINKKEVIAVITGFVGITIVSMINPTKGFGKIGDIEALLAALMISIYSIMGRVKLSKNIKVEYIAGLIYLIACLESVLINAPRGLLDYNLSLFDVLLILILGLVPTAIGHTAFLKSLEGLKPHETQLLAMLEPLGATVMAFFLFSEVPPINSLIGALLILVSIYIIAVKGGE